MISQRRVAGWDDDILCFNLDLTSEISIIMDDDDAQIME